MLADAGLLSLSYVISYMADFELGYNTLGLCRARRFGLLQELVFTTSNARALQSILQLNNSPLMPPSRETCRDNDLSPRILQRLLFLLFLRYRTSYSSAIIIGPIVN